jgi:hypothetical protein
LDRLADDRRFPTDKSNNTAARLREKLGDKEIPLFVAVTTPEKKAGTFVLSLFWPCKTE